MKTLIVKGDYDVKLAQERLGLRARSTFWRSIWRGVKAGVVKAFKHGSSVYTFDADSIEAWRASLKISSPADLSRTMDGRRRRAA